MILLPNEGLKCLNSDTEDIDQNLRTTQVGSKKVARFCYTMLCLAILFSLVSACSMSLKHTANDLTDVPVESLKQIDIKPFNLKIEEAVADGKTWPFSPALTVFKLLDGDTETQMLSLTQKANRIEAPDQVVVVLIRDGFLDDSVRGDYYRFLFYPMLDRSWRLAEMHRAWRCWRIESDSYRSDLCP